MPLSYITQYFPCRCDICYFVSIKSNNIKSIQIYLPIGAICPSITNYNTFSWSDLWRKWFSMSDLWREWFSITSACKYIISWSIPFRFQIICKCQPWNWHTTRNFNMCSQLICSIMSMLELNTNLFVVFTFPTFCLDFVPRLFLYCIRCSQNIIPKNPPSYH